MLQPWGKTFRVLVDFKLSESYFSTSVCGNTFRSYLKAWKTLLPLGFSILSPKRERKVLFLSFCMLVPKLVCTFRLCKQGRFYHRCSFGCGGARGERQGFGSFCMNSQRRREHAQFPHHSLAMHQGTFATTLLLVRSFSWKEVLNCFLFSTIFFLAFQ